MPVTLKRGDVVLTRFPFTDLRGATPRPALVISQGNIRNDVILMAISSVIRGSQSPTDILVDPSHSEFARTGLRVTSVLRTHRIVTVEVMVLISRMGQIGPMLQAEVDTQLRQIFCL